MNNSASVLIIGRSCVPAFAELKMCLKNENDNGILSKCSGDATDKNKRNVTTLVLEGAAKIIDVLSVYLKDKGVNVEVIGGAAELPVYCSEQQGCIEIVIELTTNSGDAEKVADLVTCWLRGGSDDYFGLEMITDSYCHEIPIAFGWRVEGCFAYWLEPAIIFFK